MTNSTHDDTKTGTEERYTNATHTSNLRVEAEKGGAGDMLIAAGWSASRLGAALMRLHSEFDGAEKPRRPTLENITLLAHSMERKVENGRQMLDMTAAHAQAHDWYIHELKIMLQKFKTLPDVREQMVKWTREALIADADTRVAEILIWWLSHTCTACDGLKKQRIVGTPSLSHKDCKVCRGIGETRIPYRQDRPMHEIESKRMLKHIDVCVKSAQASIRSRLQPLKPKAQGEKS